LKKKKDVGEITPKKVAKKGERQGNSNQAGGPVERNRKKKRGWNATTVSDRSMGKLRPTHFGGERKAFFTGVKAKKG